MLLGDGKLATGNWRLATGDWRFAMTKQVVRSALALSLFAFAATVSAQQSISPTDIQRLQDQVFQASTDISRLRSNDPDLASRLESELDELRDEVIYLKVKIRKEGSVNRSEYSDLRDRLQDLRSRARGTSGGPSGVTGGVPGGVAGGASGGVTGGIPSRDDSRVEPPASGTRGIPAGQEIDVSLERELSSDTAQVEDRFQAITVADLFRGNEVLIPTGSVLRGVVSSVNRASRTDRKGSLTVSFDQITVNGRTYPMRGTVTQAIESEGMRGEAGRIGAGAGVGAIIGGIIGGVRGALLGVLIGGGGTIAATEGKDVTLPPGTILRVRLDQPPHIR
jgi:hypothetical protein